MNVIVTGGSGFIGVNLIKLLLKNGVNVLNIDSFTYAANKKAHKDLINHDKYSFLAQDICTQNFFEDVFKRFKPTVVMHLAAESHVDNSIKNPSAFIDTNIYGTYNLLEVSRKYYESLEKNKQNFFRFHHISTDEVFGDLEKDSEPFSENFPYQPSSPYSASKAASDHLVKAWHRTYNLPVIITNCSNNYGPYQHKEKFIPKLIINALNKNKLPIYGDGLQIRDWLFVEDHVDALFTVIRRGDIGESYNIGGNNEKTNIDVAIEICNILTDMDQFKYDYSSLITYVEDRHGHDRRYAINSSKILKSLNWKASEDFHQGLIKTINWYKKNEAI